MLHVPSMEGLGRALTQATLLYLASPTAERHAGRLLTWLTTIGWTCTLKDQKPTGFDASAQHGADSSIS